MLDAGVVVAEQHGLAGLSVNRVVEQAGVAKGTFYVHFTDRASFVDALHERFHLRVRDAVAAATEGMAHGPERIVRGSEAYLDMCLANRGVKALTLEARSDPLLKQSMAARHERFAATAIPDLKAIGWSAKREGDYLHHAVAELEELGPQTGEETTLADRRATMMQAEKVAEDLRDAHETIAGDQFAVPAFAGLVRRLERRSGTGAATDRARGEVARCRAERAGRRARISKPRCAPPTTIRPSSTASRSGCSRCVPPAASTTCRWTSWRRSPGASGGRGADRCRRGKTQALEAAAKRRTPPMRRRRQLSRARLKAADALDKAVNAELKPLKLERAKFSTEIESDEAAAGPNGIDRVEFWVQTNPGTRPGPLMKVASGGELARFLLALKVVLADRGSAPTLVFDEIDTGVGGAVADAIGLRLARLARGVQVLAVTHAPQVAARADRHYLITKDALEKGKRVATRVTEVAKDQRREEIARMLAGAEITDEARAAAERLIKAAG